MNGNVRLREVHAQLVTALTLSHAASCLTAHIWEVQNAQQEMIREPKSLSAACVSACERHDALVLDAECVSANVPPAIANIAGADRSRSLGPLEP